MLMATMPMSWRSMLMPCRSMPWRSVLMSGRRRVSMALVAVFVALLIGLPAATADAAQEAPFHFEVKEGQGGLRLPASNPPAQEIHLEGDGTFNGPDSRCEGDGIDLSSRAGTALPALVAGRLGLTDGLCAALSGTPERAGARQSATARYRRQVLDQHVVAVGQSLRGGTTS
jgi:hypothetical protein